MLKLAGFLAALVAATSLSVAPANAGTGASHFCFDGGWTDIPLLPGPVTLGVEIETTPTTTAIVVCYATSAVGYGGGHTTGGFVKLLLHPNGSGQVQCQSDENVAVIDLDCVAPFAFDPTTGGFEVSFEGMATSTLTSPIMIGKTGIDMAPFISVSPGVTVNPSYPCVTILGTPVLPAFCGTPIIP